jgi:hypothetical protein
VWGTDFLGKKKGAEFLSNPLFSLLVVPRGFEPLLPA